MIKYRVLQKCNLHGHADLISQKTITKIFADKLSELDAAYVRDNLLDNGEENIHIEKYEYRSPSSRRLGRDPDLH